ILFHAQFLGCGWIGVQLFFVLSGFLITSILIEAREKFALGGYLKQFYIKRILRIFPIYYLYLAALACLFFALRTPASLPADLPYLLTYVYNYRRATEQVTKSMMYVHLWSLSIEEQFYLFWPFVVFFLSKKWLAKLCAALILIIPLAR